MVKNLFCIVLLGIALAGCISRNRAGTLPVFMDPYILTTDERFFELSSHQTGTIIQHQSAFPCSIDSIIYNSTSIIKVASGDTITVYSPCLSIGFEPGAAVEIIPLAIDQAKSWNKREILRQFPKKSEHYPYYRCVSCPYKNTIGMVSLSDKK